MATFIKGVTDQFGPLQLYKPDYQFLTQVYGTRQAEYDRGFSMVRNLYNSVLNSAVTNSDNQSFRQEAFKKLQGALKSVSNVDLSNPTNIMRAQGLIDPISQDQDLAYDMAVTRFHQAQKQKMDQYKNSTDPKMRAMYNDYSKMDIAFAEEDLRNAKRGDGSLQSVQPREFVPFEDTMEFLRKAAKEQGLEISQATPDGKGYIIKRVNGSGAVPIFSQWAKATMGNRFDRQFQVIGRVSAEGAIRNEMSTTGISREEAVQKISQKLLPVLNEKKSLEGIDADKQLKSLDDEIALYEKKYPNGFPPGLPNVKEDYAELLKKREQYKNTLDGSKSDVAKMQSEGPAYVASNLYSLFSSEAKENAANVFGATYAMAKQSVEYKSDASWATRYRVASQERIAAANLNFKEKDLQFRMQKQQQDYELKVAIAQGKGALPKDEYLGMGLGEVQYGSDLVSTAMKGNREKLFLNTFNAENGLALLVLNEDANAFSKVKAVMSKVKARAEGSGPALTKDDWTTLYDYSRKLGIDPKTITPKNRQDFHSTLDVLYSATYTAATEKIGQYSRMHKSSDAKRFLPAFQQSSATYKILESERENLNKNLTRLQEEVVDANGQIKPEYKGAVIRGRSRNGIYDIDYSGVSVAGKTRLQNLVTEEYASRSRPVGSRYNMEKLDPKDIDLLINNPYAMSSITVSDGSKIEIEKLRRMPPSEVADLFGNQAEAFFDGKNVQVKLNLSQKSEYKKQLGLEKSVGTVTVTIPYESIKANPALKRYNTLIQRNSVPTQSLGILEDFMNNPNARVEGTEYHSKFGFDYNITGVQDGMGNPSLLLNINYYNPSTNRMEPATKMIPYSLGDVNSLLKANEAIETAFDRYINGRSMYENK
jgi:hypothetical protein